MGSDGHPKYECEIVNKNTIIEGVINIDYRVKWQKYNMGTPTGNYNYLGSSKKNPNGKTYTKTVYIEPVTDEQIILWSKEAMKDAVENNRFKVQKEQTYIYGIAKNGLKFEGYRDNITNKITTFYPVEDWRLA